MSNQEEILAKRALIVIGVVSLLIFVIGIILLALGLNFAFYIGDSSIQSIFKVITFTGEAIFFIILVAIFYIVYDKKFAKNLAFSLMFSVYLNEMLKNVSQDPRPPANYDPSEEYGFIEPGYGFPSGHSQNAVATWGYMAYEFKDETEPSFIIPLFLSILIFFIAISRVIIGVHDLQDIIGGLLIGIGFLIAFIYLEPIVSKKIDPLSLKVKLLLVIIVAVALFVIGTLLFPTTGLGLVKNAEPYSDAGGFAQIGGVILGLGIGYLLENEYIDYQPSELNTKQKILNLIIGIVILLVCYVIFEALIHGNVLLRFIRYGALSFILSFLAPLIFTKINRK